MYQSITLSLVMALYCSLLSAQDLGPANLPKQDPAKAEDSKSGDPPKVEGSKNEEAKIQPGEVNDEDLADLGPGEKVADLPGLIPLSKKFGLWVDDKRKWVVVDGAVCLNRGVLEMFACPRGTKEHESVISINCKAQFVHAALLAVDAKPGRPVQFDPEYKAATGQVIDVYILWKDKNGNQKSVRAQEWIRNTRTKQEMKHPFVFAGSSFWVEEVDGTPFRYYQADAGDLICVSNFPSATLDLPIKSSKENSSLLYEAFPDRIPPRGTRIRMVLIPRKSKDASPAVDGGDGGKAPDNDASIDSAASDGNAKAADAKESGN